MAALLRQLNAALEYQSLGDQPTHRCRELLEPIVFQHMRETYLPRLREWWSTHVIPADAKRSIVVYETRNHEQLEFLILNLCYFAPDWALTVYCSEENYTFVKEIVGVKGATIRIHRPAEGDYASERNEYNAVLTSRQFWKGLTHFEHVLLAEVDSYLVRPLSTITDLDDYDYSASKWIWNTAAPGGGGISLRRVSYMLQLCDVGITVSMQDVWVSEAIQQIGGSVGSHFSESVLLEEPIGVHQWWSFYFQYYIILAEHPEYSPLVEKLATLPIDL